MAVPVLSLPALVVEVTVAMVVIFPLLMMSIFLWETCLALMAFTRSQSVVSVAEEGIVRSAQEAWLELRAVVARLLLSTLEILLP